MFNNNYDFNTMSTSQSRSLMQKVYGWMMLGLGVSAATAYFVASTPALVHAVYSNFMIAVLLFAAQIGLVMYLSSRIATMTVNSAIVSYLSYTALLGISLASILLVYNEASIGLTLLVTAGTFGAMAVYGYYTNSDLSSLRDFCFMGLIGLLIANFVNIFFVSTNFSLVMAAFGVLIFTLFTAYDVQQIKRTGIQMLASDQDMLKVSIICALKLYLDFVNLFLYLLRLFGQKRNN